MNMFGPSIETDGVQFWQNPERAGWLEKQGAVDNLCTPCRLCYIGEFFFTNAISFRYMAPLLEETLVHSQEWEIDLVQRQHRFSGAV